MPRIFFNAMIKLSRNIAAIIVLTGIVVAVLRAGPESVSSNSHDLALIGSETEILIDLPGCRSQAILDRVRTLASQHDIDAEKTLLLHEIMAGTCRVFEKGTPVFIDDRAILRGYVAIHRKSDPGSYWIPDAAVDNQKPEQQAELATPQGVPRKVLMDTPGCRTREQLERTRTAISQNGREAGMRKAIPDCTFFWKGETVIASMRSGGDVRITSEGEDPAGLWVPKEALDLPNND